MHIHEEYEQRMGEIHGLRPLGGAACPRRVVGKQCLMDGDGGCICERHSRLLDHARIWAFTDKPASEGKVFTFEPYGIDVVELAEFVDDLKRQVLHVDVRIDARSPWNQGSTVLGRVAPLRGA